MNQNPVWYELSPEFQTESIGFVQTRCYHPTRRGMPFLVLVLLLKGERTLRIDGAELRIGPHEFFLLAPDTAQTAWKEDDHTAYFIHFYAQSERIAPPESVDAAHIRLPSYGRLPEDPDCFSLLHHLHNHTLSPYANRDFLSLQLHALLSVISLYCQNNPRTVNRKDAFGDSCLTFIKEHACTPVRAQDYEQTFGLSYHRINQKFKAQFGITVKQYHKHLRMKYAAQMLQSGMTIQQTAEQCGYDDYYFFIDSFKQEYGIAPGAYCDLRGMKNGLV